MAFDFIKSERMEENEGLNTFILFVVTMVGWNIGFGEGFVRKVEYK